MNDLAETQTDQSEEVTFDFDEIEKKSEFPVLVICNALRPAIEKVVRDPNKFESKFMGLKDALKDIATHGSETEERHVKVSKKMGLLIVKTVDTKKANDNADEEELDTEFGIFMNHGFGETMLRDAFGDDYSLSIDGDKYVRQLVFRPDESEQSQDIEIAA